MRFEYVFDPETIHKLYFISPLTYFKLSIFVKSKKYIFMKKLFLITYFLIATSTIFAQSIEITPTAGYTFSGNIKGSYGTLDLNNASLYGAKLDVEIADFSYFELSVRRNDPTLAFRTNSSDYVDHETTTGTAHYMIGFLREFKDGKIKPFGVISVGTSRYWEKGDSNERRWFFSTEFGAGAKMFISDYVGVRLQASVTTPWVFSGGGMYWGIGGGGTGGGAAMTFGIPIAHWDLSGGIIIKLPN